MAARWLNLEEMCEELRLSKKVVLRLIRQGRIIGLVTKKARYAQDWRLLDPSARYKRALSAEEGILSQRHNFNLLEFPVICTPEFASIVGLDPSSVRTLIQNKRLIPWKMGKYSLFTPIQVREFLLRRQRRTTTDRRVLCEVLVRWCLAQLEKNPLQTLSEDEIHRDDELEGKLRHMMRLKEPARGLALNEFWRRYELARSVAKSIKNAKK